MTYINLEVVLRINKILNHYSLLHATDQYSFSN